MTHALIIGGGIAGSVTAIALQRVGIDATVYEAHTTPAHEVGASMGISLNGLAALRTLDAHAAVRDAGFPVPRGDMWLGNGRHLGAQDTGTPLPDGTLPVVIRRSDLYAVLRQEAIRRGVPIHHGKRLAGVEHRGGRVAALFDDGTEAVGDLLIGADGIGSTVRSHVDPRAPRPRYVGLIGTGGITSEITPTSEPGTMHMVFGRRAFFASMVSPDGGVWWFVNLPRAHEPSGTDLTAITGPEWQQRLLRAFTGDRSPAVECIRATTPDYTWFPMHDMPPPRRWHRGRVVLVGDAAHVTSPSSGQGASMAFEDAVQLARCLRDRRYPGDAFRAYQQLRDGRVGKVLAGARQVNRSKSATGVGRVLRDVTFPLFMRRFNTPRAFAWLYDYRIDFDRPVDDAASVGRGTRRVLADVRRRTR
ncbi:FAD-dependent monooxygenase [Actinoplanes couchii]|uniref:FAD-dependent oxidoreductase n=1 Tax=Actinoplanes couchii TaxID=403638 RepID=A0ABQ3XCR3_9ACTN|nr:NAD(P)/FAD-dependent oxidoreductase [Actinoplanes couchii]MDR6321200.1 2-polyprenyl-6-methoxyphenol hydroxylase-like FAD-dependent oxidoreductase [Actinoplanes couchii]GID56308.1 FAD-dependent oxidoreductase [Actinoplanes couchii]